MYAIIVTFRDISREVLNQTPVQLTEMQIPGAPPAKLSAGGMGVGPRASRVARALERRVVGWLPQTRSCASGRQNLFTTSGRGAQPRQGRGGVALRLRPV